MIDKKQLSDEQLDEVTGGYKMSLSGDISKYSNYNNYVDKFCGCPYSKYLFKKSDTQWLFGTLISSYQSAGSIRMHVVKVEDGQGQYNVRYFKGYENNKIDVDASGNYEVDGNEYTMYAQ